MKRDNGGSGESIFNLSAKGRQQFPVFGHTVISDWIGRSRLPSCQLRLGFGKILADFTEYDVARRKLVDGLNSCGKPQPDRSHTFIHCPLPPSQRHGDAECLDGIFFDEARLVQYVTVIYAGAVSLPGSDCSTVKASHVLPR